MSGTLEFDTLVISCPHCYEQTEVNICVDYSLKDDRGHVRMLAGGRQICKANGCIIEDKDIEEL